MNNYFIIKKNFLPVNTFPINKNDFGIFSDIQGSTTFNENNKHDHEYLSSICQDNFKPTDKLKVFDCFNIFFSYNHISYKSPFNIFDVIHIISSISYFGDYNQECHTKIISIYLIFQLLSL